MNNYYPFAFFEKAESGVLIKITYPAVDFQKEESNLLLQCVRYVKEKLKTISVNGV